MKLINSTSSLFLLALFFISLFLFYSWRKNSHVRRWRKELSIPKHQRAFRNIYKDVNGFDLSRRARAGQDAIEYTYGEIEFESFVALLSMAHPNDSTVFYDLGCGVGKAVLACAMVFPVKKSCGIEIFPNLYECALSQKKALEMLPEYHFVASTIEFKLGNILQYKLEDANLIFINATAFFADFWETVSQHLEMVKPKTQVLTTSKPLRSNLFHVTTTTHMEMSWGIVEVYIQEKL